jgi:hypothetical protein
VSKNRIISHAFVAEMWRNQAIRLYGNKNHTFATFISQLVEFRQTRVLESRYCGAIHQWLGEPQYIYVFLERNIRVCPFWPVVLWFWRVKNLQKNYLTRGRPFSMSSQHHQCPHNTTNSSPRVSTYDWCTVWLPIWEPYIFYGHFQKTTPNWTRHISRCVDMT